MLMRFTGNGSSFSDSTIFRYSFSAKTVFAQDANGKSSRLSTPLNLTQCTFTTAQGNSGGDGICFDYEDSQGERDTWESISHFGGVNVDCFQSVRASLCLNLRWKSCLFMARSEDQHSSSLGGVGEGFMLGLLEFGCHPTEIQPTPVISGS